MTEIPKSSWPFRVVGAWSAAVFLIYFHANWPQLSDVEHFLSVLTLPTEPAAWEELTVSLFVFWLVALFALWGRWIWRRVGLPATTRIEAWMFSLATGMGAWIGLLFALGAAGLWHRELLVGVSIATMIAGLFLNRDLVLGERRTPPAKTQQPTRLFDVLLMGILGCFLCMILIQTFAPEIFYDSLVYHLGLPQYWLIVHRMVPMPANFSSGFPSNMELLYGLALALKNDVLAKFVHFASGIGCLMAIFGLGQRYGSKRAGLLGCLFFISSPIVVLEFAKTAVELGSAFFILSSLYCLLKGHDEPDPDRRKKWYLVTGLFCGVAMGTKYTIWIFLPTLIATHLLSRVEGQSLRSAAREAVRMAFWACLAVSPWIMRNILYFHNPIYPFLSGVFHSSAGNPINLSSFQADAGSRDLAALLSWRGGWNYLTETWRYTMVSVNDKDLIGPLYLMFLPWLFFLRWTRPLGTLGWAFLLQWVFYSLLSNIPRYWIPGIAVLSVLLAIGLVDGRASARMKSVAGGTFLWVLASNFCAFSMLVLTLEGWLPTLGLLSRFEYLNHPHNSYPAPCFSMAEYMNRNVPPDAGVILLGDARTFHINRRCMTASVYETHPIFDLANHSGDEEGLYQELSRRGFRYILLNVAEEIVTRGYRREGFTPVGRRNFERLWDRHVRFLAEDHGSGEQDFRQALAYELVSEQNPRQKTESAPKNLFLELLGQ